MKYAFVLKTNDNDFKEAISNFLAKHCNENYVKVAIYEAVGLHMRNLRKRERLGKSD